MLCIAFKSGKWNMTVLYIIIGYVGFRPFTVTMVQPYHLAWRNEYDKDSIVSLIQNGVMYRHKVSMNIWIKIVNTLYRPKQTQTFVYIP
jgi:hypothetical protein